MKHPFELGRWDAPDWFKQPPAVEPIDPLESGVFDGIDVSPRSTPTSDLSLVETDDVLGQRVVIGITDAAHRDGDPGVWEPIS